MGVQGGRRAGAGRVGAGAWHRQACCRLADARGAWQGRAGGETTMLACYTAEGPAATRPRLLRHGTSARCACDHAWSGRGLGARWVCWLGQLGQVSALSTWLSSDSVFGPVRLSTILESLNEHCSSKKKLRKKIKFKLNLNKMK